MRNGPFSAFFSMRMTSMTCLSSMRQVRIFTRSVRSEVPFTSSLSSLNARRLMIVRMPSLSRFFMPSAVGCSLR